MIDSVKQGGIEESEESRAGIKGRIAVEKSRGSSGVLACGSAGVLAYWSAGVNKIRVNS